MIQNSLMKSLQIKFPIVQAPMAGGITTTELVSAVANNGSLGSVGAGYMSAMDLKNQINEIKALTDNPFGVNIFVPSQFTATEQEIKAAQRQLQQISQKQLLDHEVHIQLPTYEQMVETYEKQIEIVLEESVPVVSFTFGLPSKNIVDELQTNGTIVMATATAVKEAIEIERLGIDVVIAQGSEAGGHRGNFLHETGDSLIGLMSLVPQIVDCVDIPVIAAGGIMDGRGIVASLILGAKAVQMGTAFLTTEESGAHPLYKQAILEAEETATTLTRAFSGKYARGIKNKFIKEMEKNHKSILSYPLQNTLTQPLRREAQKNDTEQYMSLWSGQSLGLAKPYSVSELITKLVKEINSILDK